VDLVAATAAHGRSHGQHAQQISWAGGSQSVASFSSFEEFHAPWQMPRITVTGGQLEALSVVPVDFS
jgi:hypothetical protein